MKFVLKRELHGEKAVSSEQLAKYAYVEIQEFNDLDLCIQAIKVLLSISEAELAFESFSQADVQSYSKKTQCKINAYKQYYAGRLALYDTIIDDIYGYLSLDKQLQCMLKTFTYEIPSSYCEDKMFNEMENVDKDCIILEIEDEQTV